MEFAEFRGEFSHHIQTASHMKLMDLMKELRAITHERFGGGKPPKVELVERGFTDSEFRRFLSVVDDSTDRLAFTLMATLGLRIGELTALRGRDLQGDQLRIDGLKGGFSAVIRLPTSLLNLIPPCGPDDRLIPRSSKALRQRFAAYRAESGLTEVYLRTKPCGRTGTINPRFRLSLHSLRHYAIQRFKEACGGDLELTRKFARHRKVSTTIGYLRKSEKEEVEAVLEGICAYPETIKALEVKAVHGYR